MDDIARHLGISKKTIYLHFKDKDELVYTLIKNKMELQHCVMDEGSIKAENAIDEFFIAVTSMHETLSNMNQMLFYDLQKYHHNAWLLFKSFKEKKLYKTVASNIERGIKEGHYRKDLNIEILAKMRVDQVESMLFQTSNGGKFSILQMMTELTEHFMYGLCTITGHQLINKYKKIDE